MAKARAVFLDRDGVVNEMVYYPEHGILDSPFTPAQFQLMPGIVAAVKVFKGMGYKVVLVSNQPGIAKGHFSRALFEQVAQRMRDDLAGGGAFLDREYYCFHHPLAQVAELRSACDCRKPKPGLLLQAADELGLDLAASWLIGDGLTDIKAGQKAGVKTVLLGRHKCETCLRLDEEDTRPGAFAADITQAARLIQAGG